MASKQRKKSIKDDIERFSFIVKDVMRYETPSDWEDDGVISVYGKLSKFQRLTCAIHEIIEMVLLHQVGINQKMVDKWDTEDTKGAFDPRMYDKNPQYKRAHQFAERVEKEICQWAGVSWKDYCQSIDRLKIKYMKGGER